MLFQLVCTIEGVEQTRLPAGRVEVATDEMVAAVMVFTKEGATIEKQRNGDDKVCPRVELRRNGQPIILEIVEVEESMEITSDEQDLLQRTFDTVIDPDKTAPQIVGMATEIYSGAYSKTDQASVALTIGDIRSVKGWWNCRWIVTELFSAYSGRMYRLLLENQFGWSEEKITTHGELLTNNMLEITAKEGPVIDKVLELTKQRFGAKPVDIAASMKLKQRMVKDMIELGMSVEDDGQYD